jgi:hypothetical protein
MSLTYGSEHYLEVYRHLPPYVSGAEDFSRERGKFLSFCKKKIFLFFFESVFDNGIILIALFSRLWRDQFNETDSGRFANMAKVLIIK